jgi:saccharopine dehydrogenase-like NADP-dependent oxidoreductase
MNVMQQPGIAEKPLRENPARNPNHLRAKRNILVVGGYGNVGKTISRRLGAQFPGRVMVAGRSIQKAKDFIREVDLGMTPLALDIQRLDSLNGALDEVDLVVMCVDQKGTDFVEKCIDEGINYIDITASIDFLEEIEALDNEARLSGSTVLLSVGLSPGLTNLMADYAKIRSQDANFLDIFILLGLGDRHGADAIQWTVANLVTDFWKQDDGQLRKYRSFEDHRDTVFPNGMGTRKTYRFNFSDQHTLMKTLKFRSASTWLCFDSPLVTRILSASARGVMRRVLQKPWAQHALTDLMKTIHIGTDTFILQVKVGRDTNKTQADYETAIIGHGEGRYTGIVAAKVADLAYREQLPSGVFNIEQVIDARYFLGDLQDEGIIWMR